MLRYIPTLIMNHEPEEWKIKSSSFATLVLSFFTLNSVFFFSTTTHLHIKSHVSTICTHYIPTYVDFVPAWSTVNNNHSFCLCIKKVIMFQARAHSLHVSHTTTWNTNYFFSFTYTHTVRKKKKKFIILCWW